MEFNRSKLREKAMVILYQVDICKEQKMNYDLEKMI